MDQSVPIRLCRESKSNIPGKQVWRLELLNENTCRITYGVLPGPGGPYVHKGKVIDDEDYPPLQVAIRPLAVGLRLAQRYENDGWQRE